MIFFRGEYNVSINPNPTNESWLKTLPAIVPVSQMSIYVLVRGNESYFETSSS